MHIFVYIFTKLAIFNFVFVFVFCFSLSSTAMFFLHCMLNILRYEKNILWNWWVDCFKAQTIMWCVISGCSQWIHSLFYGVFFVFSRKLCFLWSPCLLLMVESISRDTSGKSTVGFLLKISSPSWIILSVSLGELNSIGWLLKSRW